MFRHNRRWRLFFVSLLLALVFCCTLSAPLRADELSPWRTIHPGPVRAVAVIASPVPGEPGIIFAAVGSFKTVPSQASLVKSTDGGFIWTPVILPGNDTPIVTSLAAAPHIPGTVYAAANSGLYRISNYGTSSVRIGNAFNAVAVQPFQPYTIYADNVRSTTSGSSWLPSSGLPGFGFYSENEMPHFKVSQDPNFPNLAFCMVGNNVYRTDDAGTSWTQISTGKMDSVAIDPVDAQYYYVGACANASIRYFPGGSTTMDLSAHVHDFVVDPAAHNKVTCVSDTGLFESTDYGATWTAQAGFGTVPEGRMVFDKTNGNIYLPTFSTGTGLMVKMSWCSDADHDGYSAAGGLCGAVDCDDNDPARTPDPQENCFDGIDNNCNDLADFIDPWCGSICVDTDLDTYLPTTCGGLDCDNNAADTYPGAAETCDCQDNDCNGSTDEACPMLTWYKDTDGDGYGTVAATSSSTCQPAGFAANSSDCSDGNATVHPNATEILNDGYDQDCNGVDLTLVVTKALWTRTKKTLTVEATTTLGSMANATVAGYGAMTWKRSLWTKTFSNVPANPVTVTVSITGGAVTAIVTAK